jgi:hypothetical protein
MKKILLVAFVAAFTALAADPPLDKPPEKARKTQLEAFTDPDKASPDYPVHGEYAGQVPGGPVGCQVVAEGDGKFAGRVLRGGLPAEGWDGKTEVKFTAKRDDDKVSFAFSTPNGNAVLGTIGGGKVAATGQDGKAVELKRVVRHSPTEGAKPPAGAVVLFDGTSVDAWDKGKVEDGCLSVSVPGGLRSKQAFGDCTVHVEFRLPFMPKARGQARGNSGVYLQGRYEVQVLDSFGLKGENNECGGIYELHAPLVNMCYPPLQWQTYDVDYTAARYGPDGKKSANARITVKHNGVLIQDNVELTRATRAAILPEGPERGPLHLQNHGDPVVYRNVWVVEKK